MSYIRRIACLNLEQEYFYLNYDSKSKIKRDHDYFFLLYYTHIEEKKEVEET